MKQLITPTYTFTPATKTIDFTGFTFDVKRLVAIINLANDTIIYGTGISGKGYDTSTSSQIVLDFDTTAMSGSDVLQFIYDTEDIGTSSDTVASDDTGSFSLIALFKRLLGKLPSLVNNRIPVTDTLSSGTGGSEVYCLVSVASTNINVVKASPGNLYSITVIGITADLRYLKIYNKATNPVIASDILLLRLTVPIPCSATGGGATINFTKPINFSSGISIAVTGAIGTTDATAIAANDCVIILAYG
jgi:hypothetical protein